MTPFDQFSTLLFSQSPFMKQPADTYTIVIFRGPATRPLRLSIPRALVKAALIVGVCLVVGEALLVSDYVVRTGTAWEIDTVRAENQSAREKMTVFSAAVEDLKRRLMAMKEVNEQLRIMLGIDVPKPEDLANGRGGDETPLSEDSVLLPTTAVAPADQTGQAQPPPEERALASKVWDELAWLQKEAVTQERSLQELTIIAKDRKARWTATPSIWPVKGWVTSGFGPRISPFTGQPAMHTGLDIGAPPNAEVHAPANGKVTVAEFDPKMGKVLRLDHGYHVSTQYGHLAKVLVKKGQSVKRGDVIGLVGNTGLFSTGPHLHYQVTVNSESVNPQRYILD